MSEQPEAKKIQAYIDYMLKFESFCLASRPSMFPPPDNIKDVQAVHKWLKSLVDGES